MEFGTSTNFFETAEDTEFLSHKPTYTEDAKFDSAGSA